MTTKRTSRAAAKSVASLHLNVLVLHGPNLNLLGSREPGHYGLTTLDDINRALVGRGKSAGAQVEAFQNNHEGALIDRIHERFIAQHGKQFWGQKTPRFIRHGDLLKSVYPLISDEAREGLVMATFIPERLGVRG